jgi:catechol 2,3-dioxygenase-like lactoylglutathione lyase family enzyme
VTEIRTIPMPVRRPGELGVHSLNHFALTVPDLGAAERFYTKFGLDLRGRNSGLALHTEDSGQPWGLVTEGSQKQLQHLSFGIFEDDEKAFKLRLEGLKIERLDPPLEFESDGFWFRDPDGLLIEIRAGQKRSPNEKTPALFVSTPGGIPGAPVRSQARLTKPRRLAHVLLFTRDVPSAIEFYSRVLGLRLSDRSGNQIAFMHGIHGSDHHLVAFAKSDGPGLHHCSWDVPSIDDIGLGASRMADSGFSAGWGLGRHVLGSNYFHYVRDPWGSYSEYSCDMDYIPASADWRPGDFGTDDAFYVWGPSPPADFTTNYEMIDVPRRIQEAITR